MLRLIIVVVALAMIGFGAWRLFTAGGVSAEDQVRCEQLVHDRNGDSQEGLDVLLSKCSDPGMVAMMDAQASGADAQTAARNISEANRKDVASSSLNYALIGFGISLLLGGAIAFRKQA
ncbi:MAG: hypothetical protein ACK5II_01690 [Paracoccus sp. (in: a-proteobacteria)]